MFYTREPILFPPDLAAALEAALPRGPRVGNALRALWPVLAKGRGQAEEKSEHYSFRRDAAEAYAAYYLPANCLKPALVLEEAHLLGLDPAPGGEVRWLDLGTGPGTAFWGVAWWCFRRGKKLRFVGWDQSPEFVSLARAFAGGSAAFLATAEFTHGGDPLDLVRRHRPTHVSFMNSVAEIYPSVEERQEQIARLTHLLADLERKDGVKRTLLVIEPGSRDSSRELSQLKDALRPSSTTLLPCLDQRDCGALRDPRDWCHEEVACEFPEWLNELGAAAGMRKEALLFSYAWLRAGAEAPLAGACRMVSQRMERKGQVECRLCTPQGKVPARVQRSKTTPRNEFFLEAARGELWRNMVLGEKGDVESAEAVGAAGASLFQNS
jgi:hypothetical protein